MFVPHVEQVGGFSFVSTPYHLSHENTFELAIKKSVKSKVVAYIHDQLQINDPLFFRTGGNFRYHASPRNVLFLAGGVGITPLFSMIQHLLETQVPIQISLLYSVKKEKELLFRERIDVLKIKHPNLRVAYFCTDEGVPSSSLNQFRIQNEHVKNAIKILDPTLGLQGGKVVEKMKDEKKNVNAYICGPPEFEAAMLNHLQDEPVTIYHEKWW